MPVYTGGPEDNRIIENTSTVDTISTDGGNDWVTTEPPSGYDIIDLGTGDDYLEVWPSAYTVNPTTIQLGAGADLARFYNGSYTVDLGVDADTDQIYFSGAAWVLDTTALLLNFGSQDQIFAWGMSAIPSQFTITNDGVNTTVSWHNLSVSVTGVFAATDFIFTAASFNAPNWSASGTNITINASAFYNEIDGTEGDDNLGGTSGNDLIRAYGGNDTVSSFGGDDVVYGGDGKDLLTGGGGNDSLYGEGGNDFLRGNFGDDTLDGGDGFDRIGYFNGATSGITVDLRIQVAQNVGEQGFDTITNVEAVSGTVFADSLIGNDQDNWLWGSISGGGTDNNDYLDGQGGDDILTVGIGNHTVIGGNDNDTLVFTENGGPEVGITVDLFSQGGPQDTGAGSWTISGIENVSGGVENDILGGDGNANILAGNLGDDLLIGYGGNDTLFGDGFIYVDNALVVQTVADPGTEGGNDTLDGGGGDDILYGGGGNDILTGGAGNDLNYGGAGDDLIRGRAGDDLIDGGDGFDRAGYYHIDEAAGGVTVNLNIVGPQNTGSQGWDTLTSIEYVSGTPFADVLTGDGNDNVLWGSVATIDPSTNWVSTSNNDTLDGGGGNDLLYVGIGNHSLTGGTGIDTVGFTENFGDDPAIRISLALQGVAQDTGQGWWTLNGIENLSGGNDNDELTGDGNANILAGSFGNDMLSGGGGNDSLYGDGAIDTGAPASGPPTLFADVGANGNDTLEGGLGDDLIDGGGGIDTASYEHASGGVTAFLYRAGTGNGEAFGADGDDTLAGIENLTGSAFNDQLGGNNLANVLSGGDGHDGLRGNGGNDTLYGGNGDDFLNGSAGDDYIDGGAGSDRAAFYEDATIAGVTVDLNLQGTAQDTGQGMDTLVNIENVSGSRYGDHLTGDNNDNWLWGSASTLLDGTIVTTNNDTLDGGGGNDLLVVGIGNHVVDGGTGIDTFRFNENGAPEMGITLSLLLQGAAQASGNGNWTLTNIENLSGSIANDSLTGDGNANVLAGDAGNDILTGGAGNDVLYGDGQISWDGHGTGGSGPITTFSDVGISFGAIDGNDTLEGGLGDDQLYGGGGIDTASFASASGGVTALLYDGGFGEAFGAAGYDQLHDMENLTGSAFNDVLYANSLNNIVIGGDGHDDVRGGAGNDQVYGGNGDDLLYGNAGDDVLDGGDGTDRAGFYSGATAGVHVDLNLQGVAQDTGQGMDTLIGIENLSGTQFGDTLIGDGGDNVLWGSASTISIGNISPDNNDTLIGNGGNDLLVAGIGNHVVDGGSGIDTFRFNENGAPETGITLSLLLQGAAQASGNGSWTLTGIENLSGSIAGDSLAGDGNANVLAGDLGDDILSGGAGNDTLYGDGQISWDGHGTGRSGPITTWADATSLYAGGVSGNDTLEGGLGDDVINGGGGIDTASYANASGGVQVTLFNNLTGNGTATGADGNDSLFSIENIIGSAYNDNLTGSAGNNVLSGGDGNDFLQARGGDDSLYGGNGNDYVGGGTGNDILDGGAGYDRASFSNGASGPVTVDLRIQGVAQNTGLGMDTLIGIENANGTAFADTFIGNEDDNWLWGGNDAAGAGDTIDGQGGNDLIEDGVGNHNLAGGTGIDTFSFNPFTAPTNAIISLALQGAAQDTGAGIMTLSGFENLSGSSFADTLIGDGNDNVLAGGEAGDTLIGGAGNDSLYGDGFFGTATSPSGPITFYADVGALGGIDGNDILEGGLGNDTLDGGGGTDTASYANASGSVMVTLTASGGSSSGADGSDTLLNIENILGGAFNDVLTGNGSANLIDGGAGHDKLSGGAGDDTLLGGNGDDTLSGGAGNDVFNGGAGFDRASFFGASAGVTVNLTLSGAQNTGQGMDTLIGVENLTGTQFSDTLSGDGGDNWLWGFATTAGTVNNDTLDGGGGNDLLWAGNGNMTLIGGSGNDTVMYNQNFSGDVAVTISLAITGAQNTGQGMWTLTGIENLVGGTANDTLTGDGANNILCGGAGTDTLNGGVGNDTLYGDGEITFDDHGTGGSGQIIIVGDAVAAYGGVAGNDNLNGGDGDDFLYGGGGNDSLKGDKGNDTLYGGAGNDSLVGGQGNDRYVIEANSGADTITGFTHVDKIVFDTSSGVTSFAQLTLTATGGLNTLVTWGNGNSILIEGLRPRDMTAADFQFTTAAGFEHVSHDFAATYAVPHDTFF